MKITEYGGSVMIASAACSCSAERSMKPARNARYRAWVKSLPCAVCRRRPCDPHHALASAIGQRATDYCCIPLCRPHHDMAVNRKEFARRFDLDIPGIINRLNREYLVRSIERDEVLEGLVIGGPLPARAALTVET